MPAWSLRHPPRVRTGRGRSRARSGGRPRAPVAWRWRAWHAPPAMAETFGASAAHAASVFDELATRKLVILSGKGGVGRTTTAALVGLSLAARGRRVSIATTGHDDRLAWMLGADALAATPVQVAPGLSVQRLVPQQCVREYGAIVLRSARISGAVFD